MYLTQKKAVMKELRNKRDKRQKTSRKLGEVNPSLSVIILNMNVTSSIKRQRLAE